MRKIPSPKFEQDEVTRLIATFGSKPAPEKKQELQAMLKEQKEQFLTNGRSRDHANDGREHGS